MALVLVLLAVLAEAKEYFVIAGVEGTGHHLWAEVASGLRSRAPWSPSDAYAARATQLCWGLLAEARAPCVEGDCLSQPFFCEHLLSRATEAQSSKAALFVPGCSYPCGSPKKGDLFMNSSPDLVQFFSELSRVGDSAKVVVMVRDPLASARSSFFRRHASESTFRATAFGLYLNLGYLDAQLRDVPPRQRLFLRYESFISTTFTSDKTNETTFTDLATFLSTSEDIQTDLAFAIDQAAKHHNKRRRLAVLSDQDRSYVYHLFLRPKAQPWIPSFYPLLQAYHPRHRQKTHR